jgi:hypothetical protein
MRIPYILDVQQKLRFDLLVGLRRYGPGNNWLQVAIQHSWSPDGLTNFEQDPSPLLTREFSRSTSGCIKLAKCRSAGNSFNWTAREIRSPAPTFSPRREGGGGGTQLWLSFAGDQLYTLDSSGKRVYHTDRWGIGAVTCELF